MSSRSLLLTLLTSLCACGPAAPSAEPEPVPLKTARVRVVHLSPDAPAVDVFIGGGEPTVRQLTFGTSSPVRTVTAGSSELKVGPVTAPVRLEAERDYTAVVFGKLAKLAVNVLEDDRRALATNNVRVRVIHAADGVGTVNVLQVRPDTAPITPSTCATIAGGRRLEKVATATDHSDSMNTQSTSEPSCPAQMADKR